MVARILPIVLAFGAIGVAGAAATSNAPKTTPTSLVPRLVLKTGHSDSVTCLLVNDQYRITGGEDGVAYCWDASGELIATFRHGAAITALSLSPSGFVATAGADGKVLLWEPQTGRILRRFAANGKLTALTFSKDGGQLIAGGEVRGLVWVWDTRTGKLLAELTDLRDSVTALRISPDGKFLAGAGKARVAAIWTLPAGKLLHLLKGHQHWVTGLEWTPGGKSMVTSSLDGTVRVWNPVSGACRRLLDSGGDPLTCVGVSPDGIRAAAGGFNGAAVAWQMADGQVSARYEGHQSGITALRYSPDGKRLATACQDWKVRLWDAHASGAVSPTHVLSDHRDEVLTLTFSRDGKRLLTGSKDRSARITDVASGISVALGIPPPGQITAVTGAADGRRVISGSLDGVVRIWNAATGAMEIAFSEAQSPLSRTTRSAITALALSPDGSTLAVGRWGETQLFETTTGKLLSRLEDEGDWVRALAFSPVGDHLASGNDDLRVRLYSITGKTTRLVETLSGHQLPVSALAFSTHGGLLASGSRDGTVRIWNGRTGKPQGEPLQTIWTDEVTSLAFSEDERLLSRAAGSELATWDLRSGQAPLTVRSHAQRLVRLDYSRSGGLLLGLDSRGNSWLWAGVAEIQARDRQKIDWTIFSAGARLAYSQDGTALSLHSRRTGSILATLMPMPDPREEDFFAERVRRRAELPDRLRPTTQEWFSATPQGYYDASLEADRYVLWNVGGVTHPVERYRKRFYRPDLLSDSLAEKALPLPPPASLTQPPRVTFISPDPTVPCRAGDTLTVSLLVTDDEKVPPALSLRINGRPPGVDQNRPIAVNVRPTGASGKPIVAVDKPIVAVDKPIVAIDKPIVAVDKAINSSSATWHRQPAGWVVTYRLKVPTHSVRLFLSAVAVDSGLVGSDRAEREVVVRLARPERGTLHVLAVGVSRYLNGAKSPSPGKIQNLSFSDFDALCVERRFRMEEQVRPEAGALYDAVETRSLINEEATSTALRSELRRIRKAVSPAGTDTVVLYLSGHGLNAKDGFRFGTYDTDLKNLETSTFSGAELIQLLDAGLRARQVFVFIDSCHAGALPSRNEELVRSLQDRVRICASSSALESSFESAEWKHGAFTYALLKALQGNRPRGTISLLDLMADVAAEMRSLMERAGRHPEEQLPNMPAGQPNAILARAEPGSFETLSNPSR